MTKRVRYKPTKDNGIVKSCKTFVSLTTGAKYDVYIDEINKKFKIVNLSQRGNFYGGEGIECLEVVQRHVRKKLRSLGVPIASETRDNGYVLRKKKIEEQQNLTT